MSDLKYREKMVLEKIFDRGGYVLDFSDRSFTEFFSDFNVNIDNKKYHNKFSSSKMNRLRSFWEQEENLLVGKVLKELLCYATQVEQFNSEDLSGANNCINRLLGKNFNHDQSIKQNLETESLKEEFAKINLASLSLDSDFQKVIEQRLKEIELSLSLGNNLAVILLCGSTVEGLLLHVGTQHSAHFNSSKLAPEKNGNIIPLPNWTLENLINVSYDLGYIKLDSSRHSHDLRKFRNYIHPRQQASEKFNPDKYTANISWKVLRAVIADLCGERK